jgi:hypothetical protein
LPNGEVRIRRVCNSDAGFGKAAVVNTGALQTRFLHPEFGVGTTWNAQRGRWIVGRFPDCFCDVDGMRHRTGVVLHSLHELLDQRSVVRIVNPA